MTVVAPKHLESLRAIAREFKVGPDKVKAWWVQGAPIAVEYDGKGNACGFSAEYNELQAWRVEQSASANKSAA